MDPEKIFAVCAGDPSKKYTLDRELTSSWDGYPLILGLQLSDGHLRGAKEAPR